MNTERSQAIAKALATVTTRNFHTAGNAIGPDGKEHVAFAFTFGATVLADVTEYIMGLVVDPQPNDQKPLTTDEVINTLAEAAKVIVDGIAEIKAAEKGAKH